MNTNLIPPVAAQPWREATPPRRILAIRLQAHGDTVITLPYLQALFEALPETRIDFLTRAAFAPIPRSLTLFHRVFTIGGGYSDLLQRGLTLCLFPLLRLNRYDVVADLQNNHISAWLRRHLKPRAWCAFDRFSPLSAGERNRRSLAALGLGACRPRWELTLVQRDVGTALLRQKGWLGEDLVVLNPAGFFPTRHWPLDHYVAFARAWRAAWRRPTRFLIMGIDRVRDRAGYLKEKLGDDLIDLVNETTPVEAFAILKKSTLVVSEDSGLMHMAWINGVPTIAIFGSSRADWTAPPEPHGACFHSGDLECGPCMASACVHGDYRCLTRVTPDRVVSRGLDLLGNQSK